jgi:Gamma-glutamyltransferase
MHMARYRCDVSPPLVLEYHGYRVATCPPPLNGGATVAAALQVLQQFSDDAPAADAAEQADLAADVAYADRLGRVLQCVYPRVHETVGDSPDARPAATALMSEGSGRRLAAQAAQLDPRRPYAQPPVPQPVGVRTLRQSRTANSKLPPRRARPTSWSSTRRGTWSV